MGINAITTTQPPGEVATKYLAMRDASDELLVFARTKNWDALLTAQADYLQKVEAISDVVFDDLSADEATLISECLEVAENNSKEIAFMLNRRKLELGDLIKTEQTKSDVVALYGTRAQIAVASA